MATEICDKNRWETNCCGYTFNTKSGGIAHQKEPLVAKVYGKGYCINECPGCKKRQAKVKLLTEDLRRKPRPSGRDEVVQLTLKPSNYKR